VILHTEPTLLEAVAVFIPTSLGAGMIAIGVVLFAWFFWAVQGVRPTGQSENPIGTPKPRRRE
jgi:hypothetical protein